MAIEVTEKDKAKTEEVLKPKRVLNVRNVTTIPNSIAEHNIYTYSTDCDDTADIKAPGFFNPATGFLTVGDIVRVFQFEKKKLVKFYEFVVMEIDHNNNKVKTAIITEKNLEKCIIE